MSEVGGDMMLVVIVYLIVTMWILTNMALPQWVILVELVINAFLTFASIGAFSKVKATPTNGRENAPRR